MNASAYPTIFVVDPDDAIRDGICELLGSYNFDVKAYPDGETFLGEAKPSDSDCILLENELPGISGFELLHSLRTQRRLAPVILLTSSLNSGLPQDAQRRGVSGIILKPLTSEKLLSSLNAVLEIPPFEASHSDGSLPNKKDK